jgi:hypothetical protein
MERVTQQVGGIPRGPADHSADLRDRPSPPISARAVIADSRRDLRHPDLARPDMDQMDSDPRRPTDRPHWEIAAIRAITRKEPAQDTAAVLPRVGPPPRARPLYRLCRPPHHPIVPFREMPLARARPANTFRNQTSHGQTCRNSISHNSGLPCSIFPHPRLPIFRLPRRRIPLGRTRAGTVRVDTRAAVRASIKSDPAEPRQ